MARKRLKPEEFIAKLHQVEVMSSQGASMAEAIRTIGGEGSEVYRWRIEYGSMQLDQVKRLKELEVENARLSMAVPEHMFPDNGPRLIVQAIKGWLAAVGGKKAHIVRGSPWENSYVESSNGRLPYDLDL